MTIRCALVGLGRWGSNYLRTVPKVEGLALTVACDPAPAARAAAAQLLPGVRCVVSLSDVAFGEVDAAIIAAPTPLHASLVLRALQAKLHVLVEKPLAQSPEEASLILEAAATAGKVVLAGQLTLHHPGIARMGAVVASGALGAIRRVLAVRTSNGATHSADEALWSLTPHDLSNVLSFLGDGPLHVERAHLSDLDEADLFAMCAETELHLRSSRRAARARRTLQVIGRKGEAELDEVSGSLTVRIGTASHQEMHEPPRPLLEEQCRHFAACIRGEETPRPALADAARVVTILHEAARSAELQLPRLASQSRALIPA